MPATNLTDALNQTNSSLTTANTVPMYGAEGYGLKNFKYLNNTPSTFYSNDDCYTECANSPNCGQFLYYTTPTAESPLGGCALIAPGNLYGSPPVGAKGYRMLWTPSNTTDISKIKMYNNQIYNNSNTRKIPGVCARTVGYKQIVADSTNTNIDAESCYNACLNDSLCKNYQWTQPRQVPNGSIAPGACFLISDGNVAADVNPMCDVMFMNSKPSFCPDNTTKLLETKDKNKLVVACQVNSPSTTLTSSDIKSCAWAKTQITNGSTWAGAPVQNSKMSTNNIMIYTCGDYPL